MLRMRPWQRAQHSRSQVRKNLIEQNKNNSPSPIGFICTLYEYVHMLNAIPARGTVSMQDIGQVHRLVLIASIAPG